MTGGISVLERLMGVIQSRKANPSERSYTCFLLRDGVGRIGDKLQEEAKELSDAAGLGGDEGTRRQRVIHEAADVTYHLLVMLAYCEVGLAELEAELSSRFGVSGLDEKASRRP
jgi:phosphoribosyl-ATP pyrophosphohydrolase